MTTALRPPSCTVDTKIGDTVLQTWFERDRAHVCLSRKDRDGEAGDTIVEWWDEAVAQAVDDGFLKPRDYHGSAFEYATHHGMIVPVKVELDQGWPSIVMAFIRHTPSARRPVEQPDRLEWYGDMAAEIAQSVLKDLQFAKLSPGQADAVSDTITGALYDMAVSAESRPAPLRIETSCGPLTVETDGTIVTARGGAAATGSSFSLADGMEATFSMIWRHADGPGGGNLNAVFGSPGKGVRRGPRPSDRLHSSVMDALSAASEHVEDLVLATREWNALVEVEGALDRAVKAGTPAAAKSLLRAYDDARAARVAARIQVEELHGPDPAMG